MRGRGAAAARAVLGPSKTIEVSAAEKALPVPSAAWSNVPSSQASTTPASVPVAVVHGSSSLSGPTGGAKVARGQQQGASGRQRGSAAGDEPSGATTVGHGSRHARRGGASGSSGGAPGGVS